MPIIVAILVGLGSFFGYVTVQSGTADKAYCNVEESACKPRLVIDFQCHDASIFQGLNELH